MEDFGPSREGPQEQRDRRVVCSSPIQSFLITCPFFRRDLHVPFFKEVTKNVHGNQYSTGVS